MGSACAFQHNSQGPVNQQGVGKGAAVVLQDGPVKIQHIPLTAGYPPQHFCSLPSLLPRHMFWDGYKDIYSFKSSAGVLMPDIFPSNL